MSGLGRTSRPFSSPNSADLRVEETLLLFGKMIRRRGVHALMLGLLMLVPGVSHANLGGALLRVGEEARAVRYFSPGLAGALCAGGRCSDGLALVLSDVEQATSSLYPLRKVPELGEDWALVEGSFDELRLEPDGTIPLNEMGSPEREIMQATEAADRLLSSNAPELDALQEQERKLLDLLADARSTTLRKLYSGRYQLLERTKLSEAEGGLQSVSVREIIETRRYEDPRFWIGAHTMDEPTLITSSTTRSPLKGLYGPDATRRLFWPMKVPRGTSGGPVAEEIDLSRIRIAVNSDYTGTERSLEMFVKTDEGWQPFAFENVDGRWVPLKTVAGGPVNPNKEPLVKFCGRCHKNGDGVLTPRPIFMKSAESFHKVGVGDLRVAERLFQEQ